MPRFIHPPLKRHPALLPLSREHHQGLVISRRLRLAAEGTPASHRRHARNYLEQWHGHLKEHFEAEEEILAPAMTTPRKQEISQQHNQLRRLSDSLQTAANTDALTRDMLADLATALHDHIRWEERSLFPELQAACDDATLKRIGVALEIRQQSNGASCFRRD